MIKKSAFTVGEIGIGLIIITFIILASAPIISHNNQQKQQAQAEYIASLHNGAEKSDVTKLKMQTQENEQQINQLNIRLSGVEEYVRQYVGKSVSSVQNNTSSSSVKINDGSFVCSVTGYTDADGKPIEITPQELINVNQELASGNKKVIMTCSIYRKS